MTSKRAKRKPYIPWEEIRDQVLKDSKTAIPYLKLSLQEGFDEFLPALRHVAQAQGMSKVARKAGLTRPALYKLLSAEGNPHARNLWMVVEALGLHFELGAEQKKAA